MATVMLWPKSGKYGVWGAGSPDPGAGLMEITTRPYDVAETLRSPEEMAAYLEACIEDSDGDAAFIAKALGVCGKTT